jgi:phenylpyruvate tautomerase PptA (4-oxalocrotonate tautomerase family)
MPYIAINTAQNLSDAQKDKIKTELGRLITIIPTQTEAGTLVDISDSRTIYKGGENVSGAFVDLRLFHKSDYEPKKKFTEEVFEMLIRELGIKKEHIYLSISEFENWGTAGTLKM